MDGRVKASFRVVFAQGNQMQTDLLKQVFVAVVVVGLVAGYRGLFRHIKSILLQGFRIAVRAGG